jgi:hypothetical protein
VDSVAQTCTQVHPITCRIIALDACDRAETPPSGLITRIPGTHRYQVTDPGLDQAMLLTRLHDRLIRPAEAHLSDLDPPTPTPLRTAARAYHSALDRLTTQAGLTA